MRSLKTSQNPSIDGVHGLQTQFHTAEFLAVDTFWENKNHSLLRIWLLGGFPCPREWLHIGSTNWCVFQKNDMNLEGWNVGRGIGKLDGNIGHK